MTRSRLPELDIRRIRNYCAGKVPSRLADRIRIEFDVRGKSVTIRECRPPWRAEVGSEWTRKKVAQLRYDETAGSWRLYASDRNGRWMKYPACPGRAAQLLDEIESDPTGIFWG